MLKELSFQTIFPCSIGEYYLAANKAMFVREYRDGMYWLYRQEDNEPIARLASKDVNKLAGFDITSSATPSGVSSAPGE